MINKKTPKKIGIVFTILLFSLCVKTTNAQGPNAPEAASFEPVDATDMVNLATGDLSYVLPLLNVPSPEGGYPITLSYHAGIAMEQEASWVGLGWSLNPGAINRSVSGQPDDWREGLNSTITNDIGGVSSSNSFFVGVGWGDDDKNSVGIKANFTSNRAFGGEVSHSYSINANANINGTSYGVGYSNNGNFSVSYNNLSYSSQSGFGLTLQGGFSTKSKLIGDVSGTISVSQKNGVGISLETTTGIQASAIVGDGSNRSSNNGSAAYSAISASDKLSINATIGPVKFSFSKQKIKYWHFDEKTYSSTGLLYAGELTNILQSKQLTFFHEFDASETAYRSINPQEELASNNPTYVSYDQYNISAQGISESITPYLLESALIHNDILTIDKEIKVNGVNRDVKSLYYFNNSGTNDFKKSINNLSESNRIKFHLNNELSSYHKSNSVSINSWQHPINYNGSPSDFANNVNISEIISEEGFVSNKNRLKQSSFIESYTNEQILNNSNLIFSTNINRNDLDPDGIGAFKVTVSDGKTYHYTIPVYQKEKFSRTTKYDDDINNKYSEQQSLSPYATHWLLTAITGPDYIDIDSNNELSEEDYGYWVKFNYGKWSDGYSWRIPSTGYTYGANTKSYNWGVKDIYYLNSIKTRTHTAFFIKEERGDYNSIKSKVGNSKINPLVKNAIYYSYDPNVPIYTGTNGEKYFPGAYSTISSTANPHGPGQYSVFDITNKFYAESFSHKTLRLKEILLVRNGDITSTNMSNSQINPILSSDFLFEERVKIVNDNTVDTGFISYVNSTYNGQYFSNIIDTNDSDFTALKNKAIKSIKFNYDYSLASNSSNSSNSGKLTLKSVNYSGKNGITVMPPYKYNYNSSIYNKDQEDDWGYNKLNPKAGSLAKITTPTGGVIDVVYESDDYLYEAGTKSIVFDFNMELKFTGSESGNKYVEIRNHQNNDPRQDIDFTNYFSVGDFEYLDIQYWWNPDHNGAHRVADVSNDCEITFVSNNQITFKLPNTITGSDVRRDIDCENENWVFYRWYNEVVTRTSNWREELREFDCGGPGNDNDKVKIKLFSKLNNNNAKGGGLRVRKIIVDGKYTTDYYYNKPGSSISQNDPSYVSSGVTSFAPSKFYKEIPYGNYIPSPGVIYEYVTVVKSDVINKFNFNVLPKHTLGVTVKYSLGDFFNIIEDAPVLDNLPITVNSPYQNIPLKKSRFTIKDKLSLIGSLKAKKTFNLNNHLLSSTINDYGNIISSNDNVIQENFSSLERVYTRVSGQGTTTSNLNLVNTSKLTYPVKLFNRKTISNNYETVTNFDKHDINTGQVLETTTIDSKGNEFKTELIPAYTKSEYNPSGGYGMGSKVDNSTNKNMLTQEAMTKTYLKVGSNWEETGVGITTWNNQWDYTNYDNNKTLNSAIPASQKTWRKHKIFIWDGAVNATTGIYENFVGDDDSFNWAVGPNVDQTNSKWKNTSTTTQYDHYSMPLEVKDINDNYASTKTCDAESKVLAVSNAMYTEMYYSGAEYIVKDSNGNNTIYFDGQVKSAGQNATKAHTGTHSISVASGAKGFEVNLNSGEHRAGKYKVSVWVDKATHTSARININGSTKAFNGEEVFAGNWVQKTHYEDLSIGAETVYITSASGTIYADDFKLHPIASSMTSYVYNEWDELWYIIGNNGLASKFEYDSAGRLKVTYTEVIDDTNVTGGFKKVSENSYNYKAQ
ncbi:hypothetical protein [Jejuia spongiicola]|uniref:Uncharacterized protein n=1 Tax=Jejuia spongiicola TaxID=2942207 RepID=A0ABT0QCZ5_9FLAO|nr:hypothetical protein [Jejuia spongiicola]MCL6294852.1 hypothetical protein [Jejuia spongiicola]